MRRVMMTLSRLITRTEGQDLLEYGFLMALIAIIAVAAVQNLGNTVNTVLWQTIANNF
ncbi:MAG: Flp family type IVb pilin [Vicinamibacterales bacterium]